MCVEETTIDSFLPRLGKRLWMALAWATFPIAPPLLIHICSKQYYISSSLVFEPDLNALSRVGLMIWRICCLNFLNWTNTTSEIVSSLRTDNLQYFYNQNSIMHVHLTFFYSLAWLNHPFLYIVFSGIFPRCFVYMTNLYFGISHELEVPLINRNGEQVGCIRVLVEPNTASSSTCSPAPSPLFGPISQGCQRKGHTNLHYDDLEYFSAEVCHTYMCWQEYSSQTLLQTLKEWVG